MTSGSDTDRRGVRFIARKPETTRNVVPISAHAAISATWKAASVYQRQALASRPPTAAPTCLGRLGRVVAHMAASVASTTRTSETPRAGARMNAAPTNQLQRWPWAVA